MGWVLQPVGWVAVSNVLCWILLALIGMVGAERKEEVEVMKLERLMSVINENTNWYTETVENENHLITGHLIKGLEVKVTRPCKSQARHDFISVDDVVNTNKCRIQT